MGVHRPARPEQLLHAPEYPRVEPAHLLDGVHGDRRPLRRRSDGARSSAPASSARDRWVGHHGRRRDRRERVHLAVRGAERGPASDGVCPAARHAVVLRRGNRLPARGHDRVAAVLRDDLVGNSRQSANTPTRRLRCVRHRDHRRGGDIRRHRRIRVRARLANRPDRLRGSGNLPPALLDRRPRDPADQPARDDHGVVLPHPRRGAPS